MVMKYIYYLQLQLPKQYKIASVDITPKKTFIYIYFKFHRILYVGIQNVQRNHLHIHLISIHIYIYLPWDLNRH